MAAGQHGRRCGCERCAALRGTDVGASELRASYEAALDTIAAMVRETPELERDRPACREGRAFLLAAGRRAP